MYHLTSCIQAMVLAETDGRAMILMMLAGIKNKHCLLCGGFGHIWHDCYTYEKIDG